MRIVNPGSSGQVGTLLARAFHAESTKWSCSAARRGRRGARSRAIRQL